MAEIDIDTERVADVPLLVHQQCRMGIPAVLNEVIQPHGNRQGLSIGWLTTLWQGFILSESDHRMSEMETWAAQQMELLSRLSPEPVSAKDFTDDRLADVLRYLGQDAVWEEVEKRLGQRLIRVYDLSNDRIRLDSTSAAVYHDVEEESALFRYGQSKDHRPDLAQFKVMLGALDPLGLPLATLVVPGDGADDPLYAPAIAQARQIVGTGGRLYIGDCKMAARKTRALLQAGGDYYLTPLPQTGATPALLRRLLEAVWKKEQPLEVIWAPTVAGDDEEDTATASRLLALGFEASRERQATVDGGKLAWTERLLVIFSPSLARAGRRGLAQRLQRAEEELLALTPPRRRGCRQWAELEPLQKAAQAILRRHQVEGLLEVIYEREGAERTVRAYRDRPTRTEERFRYVIGVRRQPAAIHAARRLLGWRLYVTHAPVERLTLAEGVQFYRRAPWIERDFRRLKGRPLGIRPLYVQREDHAKGMVRLLSLALRVLTLVEHVVRDSLRQAGQALAGLYAGNPKRETARPTTERLLKAFRNVVLTIVRLPGQTIRHVTPLSDLQRRILELLDLPCSIYEDLTLPTQANPP